MRLTRTHASFAAVLLLLPAAASAQTEANPAEFVINEAVVAQNPERAGTNLTVKNYAVFDYAALMLNVWSPDPAFEPYVTRFKIYAAGGDDDEVLLGDQDSNFSDATLGTTVTDGFFDGATVRVYRELAGELTLVRSATAQNYFASPGNGYRIVLDSSGPVIQADDIVFLDLVQNNITGLTPAAEAIFGSIWQPVNEFTTLTQEAHEDYPIATFDRPTTPGLTAMRIAGTNPAEISGMTTYNFGPFDSSFSAPDSTFFNSLNPGVTYRLSVWLRQSGIADGQATFTMDGDYAGIEQTWNVTGTWAEYSFTFAAPPRPVGGSSISLTFNGAGDLWADNLLIYPDGETPMRLRQTVVDELVQFRPGTLRSFAGQTNGGFGRTLDSLTSEDLVQPKIWGLEGPDRPQAMALPSHLPLCELTGAIPWIVVSPAFDESEWQGLVEYLAAPYDPNVDIPATKPWAHRRYIQGRQAPWTDVFPTMRIEFGNETWNGLFFPWTFRNGREYGLYSDYMIRQMEASPYWADAEDHIEFLLGGFIIDSGEEGFGQAAAIEAPRADYVGIAPYFGGWETDVVVGGTEVSDEGLTDLMLYPSFFVEHYRAGLRQSVEQLALSGVDVGLANYEFGPGFALPDPGTLFNDIQETYGRSQAAAVATLDLLLSNTQQGYRPQAYYNYYPGFNWASHSFFDVQPRFAYPNWQAMELRNRHATGDMVAAIALQAPHTDVPALLEEGFEVIPAADDLPLVSCYAFRDGVDWHVFVLSKQVDRTTPVTLRLPFNAAVSLTRRSLSAPQPEDGNRFEENISVETEVVSAPSLPEFTLDLAPAEIVLLSFEGTAGSTGAAPVPTLAPSFQQANPAEPGTTVRFTVIFSEPVSGFEASDVIFGGTASPSGVTVEEIPFSEGSAYELIVSGATGEGTVTVGIPAGAAEAIDNSAPSEAASEERNTVVLSNSTGVENWHVF